MKEGAQPPQQEASVVGAAMRLLQQKAKLLVQWYH